MAFDFIGHLDRQFKWSEETFGPPRGGAGCLDHIRKELVEIEENQSDIEEWIDVIILALDGAFRNGATPEEIVQTLETKQRKNEMRKWPDWRTAEPGKAIEHIEEHIPQRFVPIYIDGPDFDGMTPGAYECVWEGTPVVIPQRNWSIVWEELAEELHGLWPEYVNITPPTIG